jgi:hypothetical protein
MLVATRSVGHGHRRLVDAYLRPWAGYGSGAELRTALNLALRLGLITRALAWRRVLAGMPAAAGGEWADGVSRWLDDLERELDRA